MTTKELAALLHGRPIGKEITREESAAAKAAGLVVVFGYSDDNVELCGAIDEEISAWNGTTVNFTEAGGLLTECDEPCDHCANKNATVAASIKAIWDAPGGPVWTYATTIPHETFDIIEDGETWCRGLVFALTALAGDRGRATT